jgi:FtsH-binding integral membrane protein
MNSIKKLKNNINKDQILSEIEENKNKYDNSNNSGSNNENEMSNLPLNEPQKNLGIKKNHNRIQKQNHYRNQNQNKIQNLNQNEINPIISKPIEIIENNHNQQSSNINAISNDLERRKDYSNVLGITINNSDIINNNQSASINVVLKQDEIEKYPNKLDIDNHSNEISRDDLDKLNKLKYKIRILFVRKVYAIAFLSILFTLAVNFICFIDEAKKVLLYNYIVLGVSLGVLLLILIFVAFKKKIAKIVPYNYFLVMIFTLTVSLLLLFLSCSLDKNKVITVWVTLMIIVLSIVIMSFLFKEKFYMEISIIFAFLISLSYIIFSHFVFKSSFVELIGGTVGSSIFGLYFIYYANKLLTKEDINIDEYVIASIEIYSDIILMCVNLILSLFEY